MPRRTKTFATIAAVTAALVVALAAVAFADNVHVNDISATTVIAGNTVTANYQIQATNNDASGCNVDAANPGTMTFSITGGASGGVTASPTSLSFIACKQGANENEQAVTFTGHTAGTYTITPSMSGGKTGSEWNYSPGTFQLTVTGSGNHAPTVTVNSSPVTVNEGQTANNSGTWADQDASDTVTLFANKGIVTKNADGTWDWSFATDDGPSDSGGVTITATDDHGVSGSASFVLIVNNVAPTVTSVTPSHSQVLVGQTVTFTASATDPSTADTAAGFQWSFNGGAYQSSNQFQYLVTSCGSVTVTAKAKDKDGGESAQVTSSAASAFEAHFQSPLKEGAYNLVQKGSVVPVKIVVNCEGSANLTGLSPAIRLFNGDVDPGTDPGDPTYFVQPSVSGADTSGVMRLTDDETQYIYNLRVPDGTKGQRYTIAVYPFGSGGKITVVIEIRK